MTEPDDMARDTPPETPDARSEPATSVTAPDGSLPAKATEGDSLEVAEIPPPEATPLDESSQATTPDSATPAAVDAPGAGPYRTPPRDEPAGFTPPKRAPRPVIGPTLSSFGVMLWTFVVAGQFTTSWSAGRPLDQGIAVGAVVVATFVAWVLGLRRSRMSVPRTTGWLFGRAVAIAVSTLVLFVLAIVATTAMASSSSRNHDFLVGFVLVSVSLVSVIVGARLTSPEPAERTHAQKFVQVALWVAFALLSFVAGADLASNG